MISDKKIESIYQKYQEQKLQLEHPDLYAFLDAAFKSENNYSLTSFSSMVLTGYNNKSNNLDLKEDAKTTFELFIELYTTQAYSIDWWLDYRGMYINDLLKKTGLTKKGLYQIRMGNTKPKYETILRICEALDIKVGELEINLPD